MSKPEEALRFADVSAGYGARRVLTNVSFGLAAGSATALIGPNGAGKTTLLRVASGVLRPETGEVVLQGRNLRELPVREAARSIALVPQVLEVPFRYTVRQIVEQGRTPYLTAFRGLRREDRMAVDDALQKTGTAPLEDRIFNELSGGERQRVKIAIALAQQPVLLLLDEPTQNLDIGRQVELLELLQRLRGDGMTILAALHDLQLIEGHFSRVLVLPAQGLLRSGVASDMLDPALLGEIFQFRPSSHPSLRGLVAGTGDDFSGQTSRAKGPHR